ncbi:cytochrome ubiquinol oxidase subunit I [Ignatzschineria indica]|uniref:Cytochrome ubiquinol oxidase subunit I n=2 Tax=Ignatzschineria TaxID=112008 RepID=A0ABX5L3K4_9GAMM|nr:MULTISPECIES: cytochrome ubiquinol oxidase subunit I [Ignatzschineria]PWD84708.1 cytochrome ubiquinol oxidase subunit I [Ignatzschineria indica]PWD92156.1 cytochrome ubiquinol oxidase subunit I [Ignatzschineria cameli]PWD93259.1 cytochrome ubiquinol oxidase subunit I [Ignatzschineria cameli]PWD94001.1 cytochrome ubiquinol oxidase subunit I [Ignatzschineria cameli]GGZ78568.1 cytochrome ubiquinol oxidase subunit I [Ignatzschineria indica]
MELDPIVLARIQFAINISFHIIFPSINIALAWVLLFFKLRFEKTNDQSWLDAYNFWVKIFALSFAIGVVTGVTMSFQFGTNWPGFMEHVGNIAGPLLGYEVLTAFFLEATFLGVMLFGQKRVSPFIHNLATFLVAVGTTFSAFWIIALNSWMQTPAGYEMIDGVAHVTSWWDAIFTPSFLTRLAHMLLASGLTAAFLIAGISAYKIVKGDPSKSSRRSLNAGVIIAAILIPIQIFVGDQSGLLVLKHQPDKLAAIEAVWETESPMAFNVIAFPNEETRSNDFALQIPHLGSIILTHSLDGKVLGLNEFKEHPPVAIVFWSFRIMVGVGLLMLLTSWIGAVQLMRRKKIGPKMLKVFIGMTFSGWVAVLFGWYTTEIGRQPWIVYNLIKTADAAAPHGPTVMISSLLIYCLIYIFVLVSYLAVLFYLTNKTVKNNIAAETQGA